jgi:zinc D-Ala-D-Ala dipeptidase
MLDRRTLALGIVALPLTGCDRPDHKVAAQEKPKPVKAQHPSGLVELTTLDRSIGLDIRYATANNFTGRQLYDQPRAFLVKPAAEALLRAHRAAQREGFGLTIYDAYRPWRITKALWEATPAGPKKNYVANPKKGSRHNRGCAVDLTLHSLANGHQVELPSGYDEFSQRAHRDYMAASPAALANRDLLEKLMEAQGFRGMSNEWWHFDFRGWEAFPIMDVPFSEIS